MSLLYVLTSETSLLTQLTSQYRECQLVGPVLLPAGEMQQANMYTALTRASWPVLVLPMTTHLSQLPKYTPRSDRRFASSEMATHLPSIRYQR